MNREQILTILYDITSALSGEVHLSSLLTRMLQRLLFHTGYSAGCVLTGNPAQELEIAAAVGDAMLMEQVGRTVAIPEPLMAGKSRYIEDMEVLDALPCRKHRYAAFIILDIPQHGKILLLSRSTEPDRYPLEEVLGLVMGNFSKQIDLCRLNDDQQRHLEMLVETRTQELQQHAAMLSLLLESMAEGVYGLDLDGNFTFANSSCLAMLGYDHVDELLGRRSHEVMHHHRADETPYNIEECHIYHACSSGEGVCRDDEVFWCKDGSSFPVEYRSFPIVDHGEVKGAVVSFRNIQGEREQQHKLEHMQRLESLGVLAGGIAHDFNNILTAVMGNAALAATRLGDASPATEFLKRIGDSAQCAADLCKQMLAYSGKGRFVVKPVSLSELVEQMTRLMEVSIDKSVVIKYHLAKELPAIEADVAQIQQVILNLITNANEAIEGKSGVISFATGVANADRDYLASSVTQEELPEGRYVFLEVSDTGKGMDEETREKMFDPFFTTKFTGRGLGMSAVLGIIRGHKGAIRCYSEPGKGTTIKVLFPAVGREVGALAAEGRDAGDWRGEGMVLVVDDEEMIREMASMMLTHMGFKTISACDGVEALEQLEKHGDAIAAVLLDMTMPRMDGVDCFSRMKQLYPDIKVLLSSGYNELDATSRFSGKGLAGFIQKPYSPDQLAAKMKDLFSKT